MQSYCGEVAQQSVTQQIGWDSAQEESSKIGSYQQNVKEISRMSGSCQTFSEICSTSDCPAGGPIPLTRLLAQRHEGQVVQNACQTAPY
jgi:hypothetical protein